MSSHIMAPIFFATIVIGSLVIAFWAGRRSRSAREFYAAGGKLTAWQNGLAIAGDSMSAGAFLGLSALVYSSGFDGLVYAIGYSVGFPIVVFLLAERLRNLGRFTFADAACYRLSERPVRVFAAGSALIIVSIYLIAQMVGAGQLFNLLFGIDYTFAEILVGSLMIIYVIFGGMLATTWVQIIKAILLLASGTLIAALVMRLFGLNYNRLLAAAVEVHPQGVGALLPQMLVRSPISAISLACALTFGTAGLPHILMRFFTVPDARTARMSVFWAATAIGYFYALIFVIGFGAVALVGRDPTYHDAKGGLIGGMNMAAIHLAHAVGGEALLGFTSAVAFATILAVVSGLTLAGAAAVSHDLFARRAGQGGDRDERREVRASKLAALGLGVAAIGLGLMFQRQNVAYMVSLAYGIAASSTFPLLILVVYWRGLTTRGAVAGGTVGLASAVMLTIIGPSIWVKTFGFATPIFPIDPPTIITLPLAFATCFLVSWLDRSRQGQSDRARFADQNAVALGIEYARPAMSRATVMSRGGDRLNRSS